MQMLVAQAESRPVNGQGSCGRAFGLPCPFRKLAEAENYTIWVVVLGLVPGVAADVRQGGPFRADDCHLPLACRQARFVWYVVCCGRRDRRATGNGNPGDEGAMKDGAILPNQPVSMRIIERWPPRKRPAR